MNIKTIKFEDIVNQKSGFKFYRILANGDGENGEDKYLPIKVEVLCIGGKKHIEYEKIALIKMTHPNGKSKTFTDHVATFGQYLNFKSKEDAELACKEVIKSVDKLIKCENLIKSKMKEFEESKGYKEYINNRCLLSTFRSSDETSLSKFVFEHRGKESWLKKLKKIFECELI